MPAKIGKSNTNTKTGTTTPSPSKPKPLNRKLRKLHKAASEKRTTLHDKFTAKVHGPDNPITVDQAKQLLGWREETEKEPFGAKYVAELKGLVGTKVRLDNNVTNRRIYGNVLRKLKQEHLRGRWRFNGEPIIVGKTGQILNGQHTLISLVLAAIAWEESPESWPFWQHQPTMQKLIAYGIDEDDEVINTMDTCKPRSFADVIYRADYFRSLPESGRAAASRMAEWAVRELWNRTGVPQAYAVGRFDRTHTEGVAFLERHIKLLEAIKHVYEEDNTEGRISKWMKPGMAAATLYLMGSCNSDPDTYYKADTSDESLLDWKYWDRACEFFVELAAGGDSLSAARSYLSTLLSNELVVPNAVRRAVLAKAWDVYKNGKAPTLKQVTLEFVTTDEGGKELLDDPKVGGIDVGEDGLGVTTEVEAKPAPKAEKAKGSTKSATTTVKVKKTTKDVVKDRTDEVKAASLAKLKEPTKARRAGATWAKGDVAWVHDPNEEPYLGRLTSDPYETAGNGGMRVFVDGADGNWEVCVDRLSLSKHPEKLDKAVA